MKRAFRFVFTVIGLILIVGALAIFLFIGHVESIAVDFVERSLSNILSTETTVDSLSASPFTSVVEIHGIRVANPASFKDGPAIECDTILIDFELRSIFSRTPRITLMEFKGTKVHLRHEIGEGTNIGRIVKDVSRAIEGMGNDPGRGFYIERLHSEDARVVLSTNLVPLSKVGMRMITIDLTDVSPNYAISSREVTVIFLRSILMETITIKGLLRPVFDKLKNESEGVRKRKKKKR